MSSRTNVENMLAALRARKDATTANLRIVDVAESAARNAQGITGDEAFISAVVEDYAQLRRILGEDGMISLEVVADVFDSNLHLLND